MKRRSLSLTDFAMWAPRALLSFAALVSLAALVACGDTTKFSTAKAEEHVVFLVETATKDVAEVRQGLPQGAEVLAAQWKANPALDGDLKAVQAALDTARHKVQDLRVAKSTFFALADPNGTVLRNDQEQDRMSGKPLFASFPGLAAALKDGKYLETAGSMPEASGVRAPRADGQWIAGAPVTVDGAAKGIYVTGWSWSSYAYRLEFAVRGRIRSELTEKKSENEPLVYVFVIVGKTAYGAPVSPEVSRTQLGELDPLSKIKDAEVYKDKVDITGRSFGLAVKRAPALGSSVGIAVLRSET